MREPRTWHDDYWHPDAPDYEPKPERVPFGVAVVSVAGTLIAGWIVWLVIKAVTMVVAR